MTTISIVPDAVGPSGTGFRAMAGDARAVGKTPGEALDALTNQLGDAAAGTLVVVQHMQPDEFFSAVQQQQLASLMARWRSARDHGGPWSEAEQVELEALVEAELQAATDRAAALVRQLAS